MGIQGLLPLLKSIHEHRKISDFSGQALAVDGYVWLHRGAYGCATQLVKAEDTTRYVDYAMHRIRLLKHHNITPYVVFDGGPLPAKTGTESTRHQTREENRVKGLALAREGKHSEARDCFTKAVDVTPEMAYQLIKALKTEGVSYVVAPYEADAQLAFLERKGIVDGIITEDSDLLVFGCKQVLFKLDSDGNCVCIRRENFAKVTDIALYGWGDQQFRGMAMLSGCDYLPSIPGLGVKTSHKLLRKHKTIEAVLHAIRVGSQLKIPPNYLRNFRRAELAFLYQRVYDPRSQRLVTLSKLPDDMSDWDDKYVGEDLDPTLADGIANGRIHPVTLQPMRDINPNFRPQPPGQSSFANPKHPASSSQPVVKNNRNLLTNYFSLSATPRLKKVPSESALGQRSRDIAKENIAIEQLSTPNTAIGSSSGKRTLTLEHDLFKLQGHSRDELKNSPTRNGIASRFFGSTTPSNVFSRSTMDTPTPQDDPVEQDVAEEDFVTQEIGYRSPSARCSELGDVSSPSLSPAACRKVETQLSDIDDVSSPVLYRYSRNRNASPEYAESGHDEVDTIYILTQPVVTQNEDTMQKESSWSIKKPSPTVFVSDTPMKVSPKAAANWGPDLADLFAPSVSDRSSAIGDFDVPSPPPVKRQTNSQDDFVSDDGVLFLDGEEEAQAHLLSLQKKWKETWSNPASTLKRKRMVSLVSAPSAKRVPSLGNISGVQGSRRQQSCVSPSPASRKADAHRNTLSEPKSTADLDQFRHKPLKLR